MTFLAIVNAMNGNFRITWRSDFDVRKLNLFKVAGGVEQPYIGLSGCFEVSSCNVVVAQNSKL